ncbi:RagB/SusD family nutrient uptake outer membrane protein [Autumnicola musiva]|uniref:RagB/SusD family nutrient uptake outer membrane protein n=1 Tax=Autumnicola musiva TaxID=3075589 RepID=A0ABU3D0A6_9FLAO|nr:RagB/SusD family nutrient uptake outer membrane protein [Zunongwangia sp. F117]MDT0674968.1 RagB/SusD family nutrient uptake outer membrane protein [Zunongwangia sp. F117]
MKKYRLIFATFLIGIAFTSCEDELNIEPAQEISTEVALSSGENVENILIGAYEEAGQADSYGGDIQMLSDLYGFTNEATWRGTFTQPRDVFRKNIFVDNSYVRDIWLNGYEVINQANLVVDNIELVDEEEQDNIAGQAMFLRALTYFDLVRLYGAPYEAGQENSQPGVPLSLEGVIDYSGNLEIPRNSVEEVYNQILEDLNNAFEMLPASNSFFADKYAAKALLARVYLQQGNYTGARDAANDVIENSDHSLTDTYEEAFNNEVDSDEYIFAFQVTTQGGGNDLVLHYAQEDLGGRGGDITVNPEFIEMFDSETDDRSSFFYESDDNGETLTSKYTNQFANIPVIRLAEMYLIRAEANFRLGTSIGNTPTEDINVIRERANANLLDNVGLDEILKERELELAFEGFLIQDLQRTMRPVGDLEYDDERLTFPIPQREMDVNSLLEQNPGYGQ